MNFAELIASMNPTYQLRTAELQSRIQAQYMKSETDLQRESMRGANALHVENVRASNALHVENVRASNSFNLENIRGSNARYLEEYKADREDNRDEKRLFFASQTEQLKSQTSLKIAEIGAENNLACIREQHQNSIEMMEKSLLYEMRKAGVQNVSLSFSSLIAQTEKKSQMLTDGIQARADLRGRMMEMVTKFALGELEARANHQREMERATHNSELRREETYLNNLAVYLSEMMNSGKEREAMEEIDRLYKEWGAGGANA